MRDEFVKQADENFKPKRQKREEIDSNKNPEHVSENILVNQEEWDEI